MRKRVLVPLLLCCMAFTCYAANPESTKNNFRIERIVPVKMSKTGEGSYFADFGKDAFGTLELNYKTGKTETLIIALGEKLINGKIDSNPGGTIRYAEVSLQVSPSQSGYTLQLKADKRNTSGAAVLLPDSFGVIMPFRYAEIRNASQPIVAADLRQKAYFYRFDESQSDFSSSDTVLNQVWNICKYSIKATSFTGLYIDGDRERIPYEADAYINQLGHYCTDREYGMAQNTIEYFMVHPTWPTEWLLHTALMMYQDYYYSGNPDLLKKHYEKLKYKTLMDLAREDGLISTTTGKVTPELMRKIGFSDPKQQLRDIVDWPPGQKDTGWKLVNAAGERDGYEMVAINTMVNCFFYENMRIMAEIAGILQQPADKEYFEKMAVKVKNSINQKLFNGEKGIYTDGEGSNHSSLHANMTALAFGIVPVDRIPSVVSFVKSRGVACSVYGAQYLLEGLYRAGEGQYALDLMRSTTDRSWWNMIRVGSTITMEAWDMKYKPNSDWNHAWGAVPANVIPRQLWGIQPKTPGFGVVAIRPEMGDLKFSTIKMPTLHGPVKGEYHLVNSGLKTFSIDLPSGVTGEFTVDGSSNEAIKLNGKIVKPTKNTISLKPGLSNIEIKIK
ncbi:MAG TPA: alpha-L-rhamnosidase C-terminal domain-containing protein [Prolixibacteraceae bacterium]|nr:alpha-L-rhamnosidase C-terminal domain-containing protein [Prolixibacteraceae bacterium]